MTKQRRLTKQHRLTKRSKLTKQCRLSKRGGGGSKGSVKTRSSQKTKSSRKTKSINDMVKAKSAPNKLSTRKLRSDNKKLKECEEKQKNVLDKLDKCEGDVRQWEVDFDYTNKYYLNLLRKSTKLFKKLTRSAYMQDYYEDDVDEINELLEKIPSK